MEAKKHIGFLPQKPPLYTDHNVDEYLTYCAGLRLMEDSKIKEAVEVAKARCGISHFSKRLVKNLSGGYQQRLGIAQAIVHNPKFVVLDEPTNGLDPNQIVEVRNLIKKIAEDRTVILSTHILPEVQAVCDHIFMIENGQLVFSGTVRDFDNYIIPNTIFVSLRENPGEAELKELEGVLDVNYLGGIDYRLKYNDAVDVIDRVVEASVRKGWHLTEIRQEKSSLDSIFAELSKKSK